MKKLLKIVNKPEVKSVCLNCAVRNVWCNFRLLNPERNFVVVTCPHFKQDKNNA